MKKSYKKGSSNYEKHLFKALFYINGRYTAAVSCVALSGCGEADSDDSNSRRKRNKTSSTEEIVDTDLSFEESTVDADQQDTNEPSEENDATAQQENEYGAESPAAAINVFLDYRAEQQAAYIKKMAPAEYWAYILEQWNVTPEQVAEYYGGRLSQAHKEDLVEDFGCKITVTFIPKTEQQITGEALTLMNDLLRSRYSYNIPEITAVSRLNGKYQIEADGEIIEITCEDSDYWEYLYVVEIDGRWYHVSAVLDDRFGEASFKIDELVRSAA